jgi:hypothetical protein
VTFFWYVTDICNGNENTLQWGCFDGNQQLAQDLQIKFA